MNIFEFEREYKEQLENIEEWNFIRIQVAHYFKNRLNKQKSSNFFYKLNKTILYFFNALYGVKFWFRKYDYIFFSYSEQRKKIDNKFVDKLSDPIIDILEKKNSRVLMIEQQLSNRFKKIKDKNIVSREILYIIEKIINLILKIKKTKNTKELNYLLKKYDYNIDTSHVIRFFYAKYIVYNFLFKIYKPKVVFLVCGYCNSHIIKAAKNNNISTVELQHGIINSEHYGYISKIKVKNSVLYQPNYLLTFGEVGIDNILIDRIYPIGHFYLEYLNKTFQINDNFFEIIKNYRVKVAISLQDSSWEIDIVIKFIEEVAKRDKDIIYILIPRNPNEKVRDIEDSNIIWYTKLDCYNVVLHCDIHCTLYSSCAIETPTLGVPNILINRERFAENYYNNLLDSLHTKIVETEDEFFNALNEVLKLDKQEIIKRNSKIFQQNYFQNIELFINETLGKE